MRTCQERHNVIMSSILSVSGSSHRAWASHSVPVRRKDVTAGILHWSAMACQSATAIGHLQKTWYVSSGSKAQTGQSEDTSSPILFLFCQVGRLFVARRQAKFCTVGGTLQDQINFQQDLLPDGCELEETTLRLCASSKAKVYALLTVNSKDTELPRAPS